MCFQLVAALVLHSAPQQVLVYLANEPSPTPRELENIKRIAGWLGESSEEGDRILAQGILEDLKVFPEVVATDLGAIRRHGAELSGVVIAHNRLVQSGTVLVARGGEQTPVPILLAPARDGREESNPLANAVNVAAVLDLAAQAFDPSNFEFVVVVESHGDELYAITPRLGLPTEGLTKEALFERVHGADNAFVQRFGIKTSELLDLLVQKRRARGFRTRLLILSSCESTVEMLPSEVPTVLVSKDGLPLLYGAVDFEKVLSSNEPSLDRRALSVLPPAPFEVADPSALPRRRLIARTREVVSVAPYYIPLAVWLVVFFWRRNQDARTQLTGRTTRGGVSRG